MDINSINAKLKQQIQNLSAAHQCNFNEIVAKIYCTPNPEPTSFLDGHLANFQLFARGKFVRFLDLQTEILGIQFVDSMGQVPKAHFFLSKIQEHLADKFKVDPSVVNVRVCGLSVADSKPRWMTYVADAYKGELDLDALVKEMTGGLFG